VADVWSSLEEKVITRDSINGFENRLDKFLHGRGVSRFTASDASEASDHIGPPKCLATALLRRRVLVQVLLTKAVQF